MVKIPVESMSGAVFEANMTVSIFVAIEEKKQHNAIAILYFSKIRT